MANELTGPCAATSECFVHRRRAVRQDRVNCLPADRFWSKPVFWSAVCLTLFFSAVQTSAAELTAGVARIDLTPPAEFKAALGGYGARMSRPATGVHDRVFAKALVFRFGNKRFALVTADILGFSPAIKPAVLKKLAAQGWKADQLMLLASHSHTSIDMSAINPRNIYRILQVGIYQPKLFARTVERLAAVIRKADTNPVPVVVGTSSRHLSGWNRNRRRDSKTIDKELTVTRIDTRNGTPLALLVNFTAHPTFMSSKEMMFSGGWPGQMQRTVEAVVGQGVTVMYHNGAEGDQSPVSRPDSGPSRWERAERYGRELGLIVAQMRPKISTRRDIIFEYRRDTIALPKPTPHPDFMKTGGTEYGLVGGMMKRFLKQMAPEQTASVAVRLGDLVIVGIPGEMVAELGLHIKKVVSKRSAARHVVIGGLADGWISYILTRKQYEHGGYESSVSFYGPTLGERIVTGAINNASRLTR